MNMTSMNTEAASTLVLRKDHSEARLETQEASRSAGDCTIAEITGQDSQTRIPSPIRVRMRMPHDRRLACSLRRSTNLVSNLVVKP